MQTTCIVLVHIKLGNGAEFVLAKPFKRTYFYIPVRSGEEERANLDFWLIMISGTAHISILKRISTCAKNFGHPPEQWIVYFERLSALREGNTHTEYISIKFTANYSIVFIFVSNGKLCASLGYLSTVSMPAGAIIPNSKIVQGALRKTPLAQGRPAPWAAECNN